MYNVEYDSGTGSQVVEAIQSKVGAEVDGQWGPGTSRAFQQWLVNKGYDIDVDGYFGRESVTALQCSLNDNKW
jgi:lysozyme family protein